jgi:hypothetical protein
MDNTFDEYYQTEWYLGGKHSRDVEPILHLLNEKRASMTSIQIESVIEW